MLPVTSRVRRANLMIPLAYAWKRVLLPTSDRTVNETSQRLMQSRERQSSAVALTFRKCRKSIDDPRFFW